MKVAPNPPKRPLEEPKQPAPTEQLIDPKPSEERPLIDSLPPQEDLPRMSQF